MGTVVSSEKPKASRNMKGHVAFPGPVNNGEHVFKGKKLDTL